MKRQTLFIVTLLTLSLVLSVAATVAHEGREVGEYTIVFGWRVEPAYAGLYNGPLITITETETNAPVEGAETLQLLAHFGGEATFLQLQPVFGEPGNYTANLIPTRPGDYTFHLSGTLGETQVNELFKSADGEFSPVEPATDIMFPAPAPADTDQQAQIEALRAEIEALRGELDTLRAEFDALNAD